MMLFQMVILEKQADSREAERRLTTVGHFTVVGKWSAVHPAGDCDTVPLYFGADL